MVALIPPYFKGVIKTCHSRHFFILKEGGKEIGFTGLPKPAVLRMTLQNKSANMRFYV